MKKWCEILFFRDVLRCWSFLNLGTWRNNFLYYIVNTIRLIIMVVYLNWSWFVLQYPDKSIKNKNLLKFIVYLIVSGSIIVKTFVKNYLSPLKACAGRNRCYCLDPWNYYTHLVCKDNMLPFPPRSVCSVAVSCLKLFSFFQPVGAQVRRVTL